jgi:predicted NodU family carbamoyl transferase
VPAERWVVCVTIEKGRFTRNKHDGFNDSPAIQYCLDAEGITLSDISLIVQNANFGMFERGQQLVLRQAPHPGWHASGDNLAPSSQHL